MISKKKKKQNLNFFPYFLYFFLSSDIDYQERTYSTFEK